MAANLEQRDERINLAGAYAVCATISVAAIAALVSVNPITPQIHSAVWYFGASVLLNVFFLILEKHPHAPRFKSIVARIVVSILNASTLFVTLMGLSCLIGHFSALASTLFTLVGILLWFYLVVVLSWNRWKLFDSQFDAWKREADDISRLSDELIQQDLELRKHLMELQRSSEEELKWAETSEDRHDLARLKAAIARSKMIVAELTRIRDEQLADLDQRRADLQRRQAENKQREAEVYRALREPDPMLPKVLQSSKG